MTIIAGFHCFDGLLMCADSEQSVSKESKSQARKIYSFKSGYASIAIGGAGDSDMIEYVQHQFAQRFATDRPKWDTAEAWLQSFAKEMWNICVRPYRGFASDLVPDASFLIGLQMHGTYSLYKWERGTIYEVKAHTSIGIGVIQGESLLSDLQEFRFAANHMLLYAVRAMLRVKQLVQGCGGKTEVVLLRSDELIVRPATINIDVIEYLIEELDHFLLEHALRFVSGLVHLDETDDLKTQADELKRFKAQYENAIPKLLVLDA